MNDNADGSDTTQGAIAASLGRRVARPGAATADAVILADISESMSERDSLGRGSERMPLRRIDRLAKVLEYILLRVRVRALVCFNDLPAPVALVGRVSLPQPAGSTALDVALSFVGDLVPKPRRVIVISDGVPNSVSSALAAARRLVPMVIDAYYVGPEGLDYALRFMADLAASGGPGGRSGHFDIHDPRLLGAEVHRRLLTGPGQGPMA